MKLKKELNKDNKIIVYLAASLIVILLLVFTISLAFFSNNNTTSGTITVGEIDFSVYENNEQIGYVIPGQTAQKTITVINSRNSQGTNTKNLGTFLFKFNLEVYVDNEYDENLSKLVYPNIDLYNFTQDGEEYYYNGCLNKAESVNLCSNITFSEGIDDYYQNRNINIVFVIDAVQAENSAYKELWPDAPQSWVEIINNEI